MINSIRRPLAAAAAGGLAVAGMAMLATAPPAAADEAAAPTLTWKISDQFAGHLGTHALAGGATETAEKVVTFPNGEGQIAADGSGTVSYDGSVAGSFAAGGTTYYTITFAEPTVTVEADGSGEVTALVSSSNAAAGGNPAAATDPARVTVAEFDSTGFDTAGEAATLTATPAWANVLPPNTPESAAAGMPADRPIDGKSWHPDIYPQLTPGVRAHFYATNATPDAKAPAPFTATASTVLAPAVEYTIVSSNKKGLKLQVDGTGFTAETNPGDAGVYIGVAPSGELPDTSTMNLDAFAAADWVTPANMPGGTFSRELTAPITKLDPKQSYSIYTWQAHTHSNPTQDTETEIDIDFASLSVASKTKAAWGKKPTPKAKGAVKVTVTAPGLKPAGKVTVVLTKGKKKVQAAKVLTANGKATVSVPKLAKGKWNVVVKYPGQGSLKASKATLKLTVR